MNKGRNFLHSSGTSYSLRAFPFFAMPQFWKHCLASPGRNDSHHPGLSFLPHQDDGPAKRRIRRSKKTAGSPGEGENGVTIPGLLQSHSRSFPAVEDIGTPPEARPALQSREKAYSRNRK